MEAEAATTTASAIRFHPPHRSTAVKLRNYLRAQKVPMHLRDFTEVLFQVEYCCKNAFTADNDQSESGIKSHPYEGNEFKIKRRYSKTRQIVAVNVNQKWVVDKKFAIDRQIETENCDACNIYYNSGTVLENQAILSLKKVFI